MAMIRHVMPWKADGPGGLTLLRTPGRRLTKRVTADGVEPAETPALFEVDAIRIDGIDDLPALLLDLADRRDTVIIRAVLKAPIDPHSQIRRRLRDHGTIEGRFAEVPRSWVMSTWSPPPARSTGPIRRWSAVGCGDACRPRSRWRAPWSSSALARA